jgi:hypothetical protein
MFLFFQYRKDCTIIKIILEYFFDESIRLIDKFIKLCYIDVTNHQMISDINITYKEIFLNEKDRLANQKWNGFFKW